jgi:UDP-sulfoquinovose synthase
VFSQMTESISVRDIAETITRCSPEEVTVENLPNPWAEAPEHYFNVKRTRLVELGLTPHLPDTLIESLFETTKRYAHRVGLEALRPTVRWRSPTVG